MAPCPSCCTPLGKIRNRVLEKQRDRQMKAASRKEAAQATAEGTEITGQQQLGQRPVDEEQKKNDDDDDDSEDDDVPLIHKKRKQLEQQEAKTGSHTREQMTGGGAGEGGVGEGERANIQQQQMHSMPVSVPDLFFQMFRLIQQALTALQNRPDVKSDGSPAEELKAKEQEEAQRKRRREQARVRGQRFRARNAERRRNAERLSCLSDLARSTFREGKHEEGIAIERAVLDKRKQQLGEDHPDTLTSEKTLDSFREEMEKRGKRKRS